MDLTSREAAFKRWMGISTIVYGVGTIAFALGPLVTTNWLFEQKDAYVATQGATNPMVMAVTAAFFWNCLAVSMMATITVCAMRAWKNPVGATGYAVAVIVAKLTSSGMAILTLLLAPGEFSHTAPIAIAAVDLPLGLVTLWTYTMAKRSRAAAEKEVLAAAA